MHFREAGSGEEATFAKHFFTLHPFLFPLRATRINKQASRRTDRQTDGQANSEQRNAAQRSETQYKVLQIDQSMQ